MAQVPISDNTYSRLSVLKAKSVIAKNGLTVTWDDIISSMCDVSSEHSDKFIEFVKVKQGKTRTVEVKDMENEKLDSGAAIKEALEKGDKKITSEDLKEVSEKKVLKE